MFVEMMWRIYQWKTRQI